MYEKFYKLKNSPFRLSPDPSFFFGSKGHNRALAYLRYGLKQKEGFIVVTGAPGTGKTTLARALLQEIGRAKVIVAELNTTHLEAEDVLRMVAASFGLEFENAPKATLLKRMETYFISRYRAGYHILLIIDEAQNLPFESIEELRMLSNFYLGKNALLQIFLLGQEQFRDSLYSKDLEQLRQRVVASCHLEPLNQDETREYIEHRLQLVDWQNDPQVSDRAFARIYNLTKGVPRRINTFCDRLFLFGSLDDIHQLKDDHVRSVARELMYEVSAKDVKLSEIHHDNSGKSDSSVEANEIDSDHLDNFSDDIPEQPVKQKSNKKPRSKVNTQRKGKVNDDVDNNSTASGDRQSLHVVTNDNTARESSYEPLPMADADNTSDENKPDWWELVALAVDYFRNPDFHHGIGSSKSPLAPGITDMLKVAVAKKIIPPQMRIDGLSEVSDEEIQQACIHYVKNVLLTSKANYYRCLGVQSTASLEHIRTHYRYLFRLLQTEQESNNNDSDETYIRRINQAFSTLRAPAKRKEYDEFLLTIKKNKELKHSDFEESQDDFDHYKSETEQFDVNQPYPDPALQKEYNKSSGTYWLILIVLLIGVGAGGFVYLQPNIDDIKAKLGLNISSLNSSGSVEDTQQSLNSEALETLVVDDKQGLNAQDEPIVMKEELAPPVVVKKVEPVKPKIEKPLPKSKVEVKKVVEPVAKVVQQKKEPVKVKPKPVVEKPVVAKKPKPEPKPVEKKPVIAKVAPKVIQKKVEPEKATVSKPTQPVNDAFIIKPETRFPKPPAVVVPSPSPVASEKVAVVSAPEVIKPKPPLKISTKELSNLVNKFSLAYEEGVLDKFMNLFSEDALTNNDDDKDSIRNDYDSLFNTTEMRVIDLQNMKWKKSVKNATGKGDFVVTVLRRGGDKVRKFNGQITLDIVKRDDELLIKGMYHSYGDE